MAARARTRALRRIVALALGLAACAAWALTCAHAPSPPVAVSATPVVIVPYKIAGGGEIRFTVQPRYAVGGPVSFDLDITAGSQQVIGPLSGIVLESDLAGEQTVRHLPPSDLDTLEVPPGGKAHGSVTWDGKRDDGSAVPGATFSLALDFIVGGDNIRLGTTIEVR
jgi:hypothetical protein